VDKRSVWFGLILLLSACAGGNPAGIQFDASVPSNQKGLMESDLRRLPTMQLGSGTAADLKTIGISDLSGPSLMAYLSARVRYVVGESFDYKNSTQNSRVSDWRLNRQAALVDPTQLAQAQTVMWNLGSFLYLGAKENKEQVQLALGFLRLWVQSPRIAVVQVGEGMFDANAIDGVPLDATSNSFLRLATFFHEGRHSDGSGANAAFPHAICPSGDYKDLYACENNSNGPYAVQVTLMRYFYNACQTQGCSQTELTGLTLSIADHQQRILPTATFADPTPERLP
jgi:hypothetical protein